MEFLVFVAVAALAVAAALMMVLQRNAMYSALFLVLTFFCVAVFYVLMGAYFLAVVQVAVYAGAIMVLMLFVLMLLNVAHPEAGGGLRLGLLKPFGGIAAVVLVIELVVAVVGNTRGIMPAIVPAAVIESTAGAAEVGHTQLLASVLFTKFLFPFEVTSLILLGAILGAAVLARKRPETT